MLCWCCCLPARWLVELRDCAAGREWAWGNSCHLPSSCTQQILKTLEDHCLVITIIIIFSSTEHNLIFVKIPISSVCGWLMWCCVGGLEGEYNLVSSSKPQQCMCNHIRAKSLLIRSHCFLAPKCNDVALFDKLRQNFSKDVKWIPVSRTTQFRGIYSSMKI